MPLGLFHYQVLSGILEKIHYVHDEEELSGIILEELSKSLNAEAGTIFRTSEDGKIVPISSFGASLDLLRAMGFRKGRGVVGWVAMYNQPVKVDNPQNDERFMGVVDSATGFKTKNIIAAPVFAKGNTIGILEFINKKEGAFTLPDLELVSIVGRELGVAFENTRLIKEIKRTASYLKNIVSSLNAGLMVSDNENNLAVINSKACGILGVKCDFMPGKKIPVAEAAGNMPAFAKALSAAAEARNPVGRAQVNEGERVIGYSAVPIRDEKGGPAGMVYLFQDISGYAGKGK